MKLYTDNDMPYWFWGQKVKGPGHNAVITENGFVA